MEIINSENFVDKTSKGVVLVDFYADWCGPCKMIAPVLEEIDQDMADVTIVKVDVDQNQGLAGQYGVQSIPNMIIFKDGKAVDQIIGFTSKTDIVSHLQALL
ncbi:MAG: thioredoxin [Coprobacillaceae bacterium]